MAKDLFHDAVKQALLKEQWVFTADPLIIKIEGVKLEIDLAAEKVFATEKAGRKIAGEIKGFLNHSTITDFHAALGKFLNYRLAACRRIKCPLNSPEIGTECQVLCAEGESREY
jgi:hypothetical protein